MSAKLIITHNNKSIITAIVFQRNFYASSMLCSNDSQPRLLFFRNVTKKLTLLVKIQKLP